jgi:predicted amidohydrolase
MIKIGFLQFAPVFGEVEANLRAVERLIGHSPCDLLVLPELFSTGYTFRNRKELRHFAETVPEGKTVSFLRMIADKKGMAIVGGFAEREGKRIFNASVLCLPDGDFRVYRKKHLYHNEKRLFDVSHEPFAIHTMKQGVKLGLLICFDWIFPEAARTLALSGAHIICHSANLVLSYCQDAMITRAVENRLFIITANRTGSEKRGRNSHHFTGMSQIVSPEGRILASADEHEERMAVVRINPLIAKNKQITPLNDVLKDRRRTLYESM